MLTVITCDTYEPAVVDAAVERIFQQYGGISAFARADQRVCIKPNLLMPRKPEDATTTHPSVVAAVAKLFIAHGCTVEIADSCGGPYNAVTSKVLYKRTGMTQVAEETGAVIRYDSQSMAREIPLAAGGSRKFNIIQPIVDADVIINIAKLKTHGLGHYTGTVKNMFGVVAGLQKAKGHAAFKSRQEFFACLVDLYQVVTPQFNIIDGIVGMEGNGPSGGTPKAANVLLGGINGHTLDKLAVWLVQLDERKVYTIAEAHDRGLIQKSINDLGDDVFIVPQTTNIPLANLRTAFRPPSTDKGLSIALRALLPRRLRERLRDRSMRYPKVIDEKCTGCGNCIRICPENAILRIGDDTLGVPRVLREKCIRCLCCHEVCPPKAMELVR